MNKLIKSTISGTMVLVLTGCSSSTVITNNESFAVNDSTCTSDSSAGMGGRIIENSRNLIMN